jgi:hypothetical protein
MFIIWKQTISLKTGDRILMCLGGRRIKTTATRFAIRESCNSLKADYIYVQQVPDDDFNGGQLKNVWRGFGRLPI